MNEIIISGIKCQLIPELAFVHVSKTGGTSIKKNLEKYCNENFIYNYNTNTLKWEKICFNIPYMIYSHLYTIYDIPQKYIAVVIRHPIDRFISAFAFAKGGGFKTNDNPNDLNTFEKNFKNHPINNIDNINDFVNLLRNKKQLGTDILFSGQEGRPRNFANVIYLPQISWLLPKRNTNPTIGTKNIIILTQENLTDDFMILMNYFNATIDQNYKYLLEKNKSESKFKMQLTEENKNYLLDIYKYDMKLYQEIQDYDKSINKINSQFKKKLKKNFGQLRVVCDSYFYENFKIENNIFQSSPDFY